MNVFIKDHFDRILVFVVFLVTVGIYWFKATPFSEQLVVTVTGGLLGMLIGRRTAPQVVADNVENVDNTGGNVTTNGEDKT